MSIDLEKEAAQLLQEAGIVDKVAKAHPLAHRLLGTRVRKYGLRGAPAQMVTIRGQPVIMVRPGVSGHMLRWLVMHELSEWHLRRVGYSGADIERQADALAACLVAPPRLYQRAVDRHGLRFQQLARSFEASQTCMAIRLAEVTGRAVAVVGRRGYRRVHSGDSTLVWPRRPRTVKGTQKISLDSSRLALLPTF